MGTTSVWRFLALFAFFMSGLTALPTYAQNNSPAQSVQSATSAGELVPLVVRDFDSWEHAEQSLYPTDLSRAIPDTLYLYLLGYPRLGVSRGPSIRRATSALPQADQHGGQAPRLPRESSFSLEGQIRAVSAGATGAPTTAGGGRGAQLLMVRYQVWGSEPKPITEGSFVTGSGELTERLNEVARTVADKISPAETPVDVFLPSVKANCFSSDLEKNFYGETLSGLLRTTLLGTGFVKPTKTQAGAYVVSESAEGTAEGCFLRATLTSAKGETLAAVVEKGRGSEVLDMQDRINQKIIDTLHIESNSISQKTGLSSQMSAKEYMQAADKYWQVDPELASALYRKVLSLDPSNKEATNRLAQSLLDAGRPKDVVELIRKPETASQFALLASAYLKLGETRMAISELNDGLRLEPDDPSFYKQAASILEQASDYEAAAHALELGQKHTHPNDGLAGMASETRRRGGAELITADKSNKALPLILASLQSEPNSEWGQRLAGIAYVRLGDTLKGEAYLMEAMHIKPTVYSEHELGELRLTQKRYPEARAFAKQAIETDPNWQGGYSLLEDSVQNSQDASEAAVWLEKYVNIVPPNRMALVVWSYLRTKYLPFDAVSVHQYYELYKSATRDVPYSEWLAGWSDLVEFSMLDGHFDESASMADGLLNMNLAQNYRMSMGFYSWLNYLLIGDCKRFEKNLHASLDFLQGTDTSSPIGWDFTATRKFIEDRRMQGKLTQNGMSLATSTMEFLETPGAPNALRQLNNTTSQFETGACHAN
jgi:tetratricopeptide (TPR) repeat protein